MLFNYIMRYIILHLFFFAIVIGNNQNRLDVNGQANFNYIARLSNYSIINLPYRLFSANIKYGSKKFLAQSTIAIEHRIRKSTDFLESTSPTDFSWDLRELYLYWETKLGVLKIGKQISSWGSVDENSPLDIINPIDYYYLFSSGINRKLATFSANYTIYKNNTKFNIIFSPIHNTNRIPLNDSEFPIELPLVPEQIQIFNKEKNPNEYGLQVSQNFRFGDLNIVYFSGFDRVYNFTGVNTWGQGVSLNVPRFDILFGYRKTEMIGLGGSFFGKFFTLRADIGFFKTRDLNNQIDRNYPNFLYISSQGKYVEIFDSFGYDSLHFSFPMNEKADYYQSTIQIETELPFDIDLIGQIFLFENKNYSSDSLPISEDIPLPVLNDMDFSQLNPKNFFTPGIGAPLAVLSKKISLISLEKKIFDDQLKLTFGSMLDIDNARTNEKIPGSLYSLNSEYNLYDNVLCIAGITKIKSSDDHPDGEDYRFKKMENFSHFHFQLKYFF